MQIPSEHEQKSAWIGTWSEPIRSIQEFYSRFDDLYKYYIASAISIAVKCPKCHKLTFFVINYEGFLSYLKCCNGCLMPLDEVSYDQDSYLEYIRQNSYQLSGSEEKEIEDIRQCMSENRYEKQKEIENQKRTEQIVIE